MPSVTTKLTTNDLCPHCGRSVSIGGGPSREHIFPEAFGGRTTVIACADCNSGVGAGVEGRLLGSSTAMTFFQQGSGLPHKEMTASNALGEFRVDLGTGKHTAKLRVGESEHEGTKTYQIFGTPEDAKRVLEGLAREGKISTDRIGELIESGRIDPSESENLTMTITLDLILMRRLLAKVSLCVLAYLKGDNFISTDMAGWLRQVLDVPRHWGKGLAQAEQPDPAGVGATEEVDTQALFGAFWNMYQGADETLTGERGDDKCQLLIWPLWNGDGSKTIFALSLLGVIIPTGLVVPGQPSEMFAPTMFSERVAGPPVVRDLAMGLPNGS